MNTQREPAGREQACPERDPSYAGWFGIPALPRHYVSRPRLLDALDQNHSRPLILVSAPAGSGKTALIADWVATGHAVHRTAWVTFEEQDDAFWPGLVSCLEALGVPVATAGFTGAPGALDRRLLTSLAVAVAGSTDPLRLVVDGYELVSADVANDLDFLLRHSGHRLQLVMVTRADPVLPLYRYRLEDTLAEIRMANLAFDDDEARQLLKVAGVDLTTESVRELNARTKGWATGLRFAAKILVDRDDPESGVADVAGDTGSIGEYLMGEVLAAQTPAVRKLLLSTSIPDTIQPGLAEELAGRSAARTLAFLTRVNAFIEAVPEHPGFYRYHPFFRDLLRAELAYESPKQMVRLQRKAARWFAREGLLAASVNHFAAIDAWAEAAGEVVDELAVGQLLVDHGTSALGRSLRRIPADVADPSVSVVRATLALADGDIERFSEELEHTLEVSEEERSSHPSVSLAVAVLQAVRARFSGDPRNAIALAEAAEQALNQPQTKSRADTHPELAALVLASKGIAMVRRGQLTKADETFTAGTGAATRPGCESLLVECLGYMALIGCFQGQLSRARTLASRAVGIADSLSIPMEDRQSAAQVALAWVDVEQYELRSAVEHVKVARKSDFISGDFVVRALLAMVTARLQVARGDLPGAITTVDRAVSDAADPASWLVVRLRIEAANLRLANGEGEVAVLDVEGLGEGNEAEVALVLAQAQMQSGQDSAVEDSLARVLVRGAPSTALVTGWLVESARQLRRHSPARARVALDRSLKLAEPECLRRPFLEATPEVRKVLVREAQLITRTSWLHVPSDPGHVRITTQRRAPREAETEADPATPVVETLTEKELEVLGHLAELLTTEEIAGAMFVSVNTIRTHVRSILRKLGVSRRNAAVRRARELELLTV